MTTKENGENALIAFIYDAKIPTGKSLEEMDFWIQSDFFLHTLEMAAGMPIPVVETAKRGFKVRREDGGVNHYNVIQIKGRTACPGQPKMRDNGSIKYWSTL